MTKDPRQALSYGLNHLLFDGKSPDAVADIRRTFDENEKVKQSLSAYQFKDAHPEFRANPQVVAQLDKLRSDMGLPFDYNGLEAAYLMGINRGVLPNFPAQYQQELAQRTQQFMPQQQQIPPDPYAQYVPGYIPTAQGAPQTMDPRQFNGGMGYQPPVQNGRPQNNNPYTQAPPGVPRGSNTGFGGTGSRVDPEDMTPEQIEAILNQAGQGYGR